MAVLIVLYIVAMAGATFFEAATSTGQTMSYFYHSYWFLSIEAFLVVNFVALSFRKRLYERRLWGVVVLHWAFVVVLAGAFVTHVDSREGVMHIREGESSSTLLILHDGHVVDHEELPFTIRLNDFVLERYPGSMSPSYFESDVDISYQGESRNAKIFMNNIAHIGPYRVYQSSYDPDERGTVLTVNRDRIGTVISYVGYVLLMVGMLMSFFDRNGRFRYLVGKLSQMKRGAAVAVLVLFSVKAYAGVAVDDQIEKRAFSRRSADAFAALLVQNPNGRVEPLGTYADKIMRKLHRSESYGSLSSVQVVLGMMYEPYAWARVPLMELSGPLAEELWVEGKYASFNEMFDRSGGYRIAERVDMAYSKDATQRTKMDKEIIKLDEQVNILNALLSGRMLPIFPVPGSDDGKWLSAGDDLSAFEGRDSMFVSMIMPYLFTEHGSYLETGNDEGARRVVGMIDTYQRAKALPEHLIDRDKVEAELFYNRHNIFKISAVGYLACGGILLAFLLWALLRGTAPTVERRVVAVAAVAIGLFFLYAAFGMGLRWYISGRAPWTNTYESMVYAGWCAVLAGLLFTRRSPVALAVATIMGGAVVMISQLNFLDPEITPLVPVLKSYWLMFHVAVVTASYGFFAVGALLGLVSLVITVSSRRASLRAKVEELTVINELALIIGLVLLTAGVFLGAVWANESWGRYWGWDPKETWALITMMVYAFVLHARLIPALRGALKFSVMSIFAVYSVLMTFFGVNYYLTGMHSYGSGHSINIYAVAIPSVIVIALTMAAVVRSRR